MNIQTIIQNITSWFLAHGIKITLILITAFLINKFLKTFIRKAVKKQIADKMSEEGKKRVETLISVFEGTFRFIIWIVALLMILPELGVSTAPILASIGIAGLAVGMATKDIVSDFISGLFIIMENQYDIGDKVKIAGLEGRVEEITLRRTIIKDEEGTVHSIPNSKVTLVSKKS
ncbi:MAG: mechanosensitive ion channel family protein [Patescibacteria group bacterium]|nr:mechanosensitive ion channel family protein [Patescibacteria group bacterium]